MYAGVLHRDFKPDNVLVGADGRVRVTDFGLAMLGPTRALTIGGAIVGTPAYMAYEQLVGLPVDARADQFAFAVTACEALYGARPFAGTSVDDVRMAMESTPQIGRAPDVPPAIARVLARGLARDPAQRWPSMRALLAELRAAAFGSAELHLRVHTIAQLVAGGVHLVLCVALLVSMARTPDEPSSTSGSSDDSGALEIAAGLVLVFYLVTLLGWLFLGVVWGPLNALGLHKRWAWARWSTMAYGVLAALSCCALPYGAYAVWAMTRAGVRDAFARGHE
jgi:serine/threonine protein kinase